MSAVLVIAVILCFALLFLLSLSVSSAGMCSYSFLVVSTFLLSVDVMCHDDIFLNWLVVPLRTPVCIFDVPLMLHLFFFARSLKQMMPRDLCWLTLSFQ
jgi:hypothetical protein